MMLFAALRAIRKTWLIHHFLPFIEKKSVKGEFISLTVIRFASLYPQERNIQIP